MRKLWAPIFVDSIHIFLQPQFFSTGITGQIFFKKPHQTGICGKTRLVRQRVYVWTNLMFQDLTCFFVFQEPDGGR